MQMHDLARVLIPEPNPLPDTRSMTTAPGSAGRRCCGPFPREERQVRRVVPPARSAAAENRLDAAAA
ncbi:hypothetical protein BFN67_11955 [Pseudaminobacter manganicus]|uniref:Uncharacterized protein n=1 Tax=Manganibacter manganicus TaxID=1873176 RepID=A0A1V8RUM6_9HYPH|nr:hypothetical protein BFN67_11955 [Pseudaminobacter manganicus]